MSLVDRWFDIGDTFAFSYLYLSPTEPITTSVPRIFLISHAIEAYLKGCLIFSDSTKDPAKYGHKLYKIYDELKADHNFLPNVSIPKSVYDKFTISHEGQPNMPTHEESLIIEKYRYLLICLKFGADLKYFGARLKSNVGDLYGFSSLHVDYRYADLIVSFREYIGRASSYYDTWYFAANGAKYSELPKDIQEFVAKVRGCSPV